MSETEKSQTFFSKIRPFVFAGLATMCSCAVVQPLSCMVVRIQIFGEEAGIKGKKPDRNPIRAAKYMWRTEGIKAFYRGLGAGLLRQATFGTTRLGVYRFLFEREKRINLQKGETGDISGFKRLFYSLFSGFCGALVGSPIDIAMVRLQSEHALPVEQRRNYRHVFHAISSIARNEGVGTLWRGFTGFALRVMAATSAQIVTFEETKILTNKIRGIEETDLTTRFIAIFFSGVFCTAACLPFDNVKMKMQKMTKDGGETVYKGFSDCMVKTIRREGILGPWIGFSSFYMYAAPHTMISFLILDYLHHYFGDENLK